MAAEEVSAAPRLPRVRLIRHPSPRFSFLAFHAAQRSPDDEGGRRAAEARRPARGSWRCPLQRASRQKRRRRPQANAGTPAGPPAPSTSSSPSVDALTTPLHPLTGPAGTLADLSRPPPLQACRPDLPAPVSVVSGIGPLRALPVAPEGLYGPCGAAGALGEERGRCWSAGRAGIRAEDEEADKGPGGRRTIRRRPIPPRCADDGQGGWRRRQRAAQAWSWRGEPPDHVREMIGAAGLCP